MVACDRHPVPALVRPVRIAAGAFAPVTPAPRPVAVARSRHRLGGRADPGQAPGQRRDHRAGCLRAARITITSNSTRMMSCWRRGCRWRVFSTPAIAGSSPTPAPSISLHRRFLPAERRRGAVPRSAAQGHPCWQRGGICSPGRRRSAIARPAAALWVEAGGRVPGGRPGSSAGCIASCCRRGPAQHRSARPSAWPPGTIRGRGLPQPRRADRRHRCSTAGPSPCIVRRCAQGFFPIEHDREARGAHRLALDRRRRPALLCAAPGAVGAGPGGAPGDGGLGHFRASPRRCTSLTACRGAGNTLSRRDARHHRPGAPSTRPGRRSRPGRGIGRPRWSACRRWRVAAGWRRSITRTSRSASACRVSRRWGVPMLSSAC